MTEDTTRGCDRSSTLTVRSAAWRRLRGSLGAGRCLHMNLAHDETFARAPQVGTLIHETIGLIATETLTPTPSRIMALADACVDQFPRIEGRAHRQNIAAGASAYFSHLLPPALWMFHGTEIHLGHGRLDLVWSNFRDEILIDEAKTGHSRSLRLQSTREQVEAYRACAVGTWGPAFVGVRLLSTSDPYASLFIAANGTEVPLFATSFVRGA